MKLGLGTAQLDLAYGVANSRGRMAPETAVALLEEAAAVGVPYLDTAPAYGCSEDLIGRAMPACASIRIVTKTIPLGGVVGSEARARTVVDGLRQSLLRMRRKSVYGLLVHHAEDLLSNDGAGVVAGLERVKREGLAEKVGISVYTPAQVDAVLSGFRVDIVQVPINVFDQRLVKGGQLKALKSAGIEIHARSAFLQGALLSPPGALPSFLRGLDPRLQSFQGLAARLGLTPAEAAFGFLTSIPELEVVICGVDGLDHLRQLYQASHTPLPPGAAMEFQRLACDDIGLIDPSRWPRDKPVPDGGK